MKMDLKEEIFSISLEERFNELAIEVFKYQYLKNKVYRDFVNALSVKPSSIRHFTDIPFLPIRFFKSHKVVCGDEPPEITFLSSGTTGIERSRHYVTDIALYRRSLQEGFTLFYGSQADINLFALVPSKQENPSSSLGFMMDQLMEEAHPEEKNFFIHDFTGLSRKLNQKKKKTRILVGLTSALLDFSEQSGGFFPEIIIIETGGMKGKRKEMIREDLHNQLCKKFGVKKIHSEYGMTELLSQAYSSGDGIFGSPPWMRVLIRDTNDPFALLDINQTGGINIIDLANLNSCSFIATQDLGRLYDERRFEVLGRFDDSDIRGCNLMAG